MAVTLWPLHFPKALHARSWQVQMANWMRAKTVLSGTVRKMKFSIALQVKPLGN